MDRPCRGNLQAIAIALPLLLLPAFSCTGKWARPPGPPAPAGAARNVILFIGDGMGFEQVKAAGMFATGRPGTLSFESFPFFGSMHTGNAGGEVTDSAAASTAMATGIKVGNGVISMALPGNGAPLETALERFQASGKSTGLVTTTIITHATPAAFGAHEPSRHNFSGIAGDYLNDSRPNVLLGGAEYLTADAAVAAGYTVVVDRDGLQALDPEVENRVSGQFGSGDMPYEADGLGGLPTLSEMTLAALRILENDPDGFFLMVEGGRIDHACHSHDIGRAIGETIEFSRAVEIAAEWSDDHPDTVLIVTADHETGGMRVLANNGMGNLPSVAWGTTGHTSVPVPVFARGVDPASVPEPMENTNIFDLLMNPSARSEIRSDSAAIP